MSVLLLIGLGMYLGIGLMCSIFWVFFSILGNEPLGILFGLTGPLTWPIMVLRIIFGR